MSANTTRLITLCGALVVLGAVNHSIYSKEAIIRTGEVIYLELAPVDPRSLMQGDYMALRFHLAGAIDTARTDGLLAAGVRSAPLAVDGWRVATLDASGRSPVQMRFRIRNHSAWLGTNAYFFAEGSAARYAPARYGEFRLDRDSGEAVLVGLRDAELNAL